MYSSKHMLTVQDYPPANTIEDGFRTTPSAVVKLGVLSILERVQICMYYNELPVPPWLKSLTLTTKRASGFLWVVEIWITSQSLHKIGW